ncbi:MAG: SPOR domain-containing protein [Candidatus Zixiibacteriota bacterium]
MKKRIVIYRPVAISLAILLLVGCIVKKEVAEEEKERPSVAVSDPRGFDPLELPEDHEVVPVTHPRSADIAGQSAFVQADATTDTSYQQPDVTAGSIDTLNNQAFRIQIFTSKVYGDARFSVKVAEEIFDRPIFLDYEVPYYKVRVGNFSDREKAEDYMMRVKEAGYTDAWVVAVTVRVNEATPLYEDLLTPQPIDSLPAVEEPKGVIGNDEPEN